MAYTPARKEMNDGEGPQRAENKEIAQETLHAHLHRGVVGGGKPEDPISRRVFVKMVGGRGKPEDPRHGSRREGENPKTPIIGCAISRITI